MANYSVATCIIKVEAYIYIRNVINLRVGDSVEETFVSAKEKLVANVYLEIQITVDQVKGYVVDCFETDMALETFKSVY